MLAFLSFHRSALTLVSVAFSRLSNQEVSEFSVSGRSKAYRRLVKKDKCVYTIEIYNRGMSHFNNVLMNLNVDAKMIRKIQFRQSVAEDLSLRSGQKLSKISWNKTKRGVSTQNFTFKRRSYLQLKIHTTHEIPRKEISLILSSSKRQLSQLKISISQNLIPNLHV